MLNRYVYVVLNGEDYEGNRILGVYNSFQAALELIQSKCEDPGMWEYFPDTQPNQRLGLLEYDGCQYYAIDRWTVED